MFIRHRQAAAWCERVTEASRESEQDGAKQVLMVGRDTRSGPVAQPG